MMSPSQGMCTNCGTPATPDASFCESCGEAISGATPVSARKRAGGRGTMHGYSLKRKMHGASGALLAVAIFQTLGLLLVYYQMKDVLDVPEVAGQAQLIIAIVAVLAVCFWGLWWWSKTNPFVAGVVGLVLYVTLQFVAALVEPSSLFKGIIIKVIIIVVLVKAVMAGAEYRRTMRAQGR